MLDKGHQFAQLSEFLILLSNFRWANLRVEISSSIIDFSSKKL